MNMITRIEKMLNEQGIKRSTMLADLNIPSSTFSTWKKKGSDPDLKSVIKLANYLGASMDYILNGETENIQKIELDDEPIQIRVLGKVAAGVPVEARCCTDVVPHLQKIKKWGPKPPSAFIPSRKSTKVCIIIIYGRR